MGLCNGPGAAFSDGAVEPDLSPHLFMRAPVSLAHFGGQSLGIGNHSVCSRQRLGEQSLHGLAGLRAVFRRKRRVGTRKADLSAAVPAALVWRMRFLR